MSDSESIVRDAQARGWEQALSSALHGEEFERAWHPERAAFIHLLPAPGGTRVLELDAGWGCVTIELAKASFRVKALERDAARARFISLRADQEGVAGLVDTAIGSLESIQDSEKFEAIIVREPVTAFTGQLSRVRAKLAPQGVICVGGPIRPLWATRADAATYETYIDLFARAGLRVRHSYASPRGFHNPSELVPLQDQAIRHYTHMRLMPAGKSLSHRLKNQAKTALASPAAWKLLAPAMIFFLEACNA